MALCDVYCVIARYCSDMPDSRFPRNSENNQFTFLKCIDLESNQQAEVKVVGLTTQ